MDPSKYRGVSVGSTVWKLIINIILEQIRPWYEVQLSKEQNGFRRNCGATDGIYSMKRIQRISNCKKQTLYLLFVDLKAAFDCISRKWLFNLIRLRSSEGEGVKLFNILWKLYQKTSLTYQEAQVTFLVTSDVCQGGSESPCLFNLYIDFVMHVFMNNCKKDDSIQFFKHEYRITVRSVSRNVKLWGSSTVPWCSYADDLILFMLDIHSLQRATTILDEVFTNYGLCINIQKTEAMILSHMLFEDKYPDTIISLCNVLLQNSTEFKYLGSYIYLSKMNLNILALISLRNEPNTGDIEINHCIKMAYAKFATIANLLQNSKIHLKTRIKFLNSFVLSRLTYSWQNWNLTVGQFEKFDVMY